MSKAILVAGLGFGDEGKGTTVEFLASREKAHTVVRYNGGAQAAHNVVLADGRHHTFAQFGSATFQGVHTYLSEFMLVDPLALAVEAKHLRRKGVIDPWALLTVDERAPIITPWHRAVNRLKEISRGGGQHGTCGVGVGECMSDFLRFGEWVPVIGDLRKPNLLLEKLHFIRGAAIKKVRDIVIEVEWSGNKDIEQLFSDPKDWVKRYLDEFVRFVDTKPRDFLLDRLKTGTTIFEGAQGVLLDQDYGFHPHTTWTDITFRNAYRLLESVDVDVEKIGVLRSHMTRHGAGPFPTWDPTLKGSDYDEHNGSDGMQGVFRVGPLDFPLIRYAINQIGPLDGLSVTHLDRPILKVSVGYDNFSNETYERLLESRPFLSKFQPSLEAQEKIGRELIDASPVFKDAWGVEELIAMIRHLFHPNIRVQSYGPRLEDKR